MTGPAMVSGSGPSDGSGSSLSARQRTNKKYNAKLEVKARKKAWEMANREKINLRSREYRIEDPIRVRRNHMRHYYKKYFGLSDIPEKNPCKKCGSEYRLHLHHRDGNNGRQGKPMNNQANNFVWLCNSCHAKVHSQGRIMEYV